MSASNDRAAGAAAGAVEGGEVNVRCEREQWAYDLGGRAHYFARVSGQNGAKIVRFLTEIVFCFAFSMRIHDDWEYCAIDGGYELPHTITRACDGNRACGLCDCSRCRLWHRRDIPTRATRRRIPTRPTARPQAVGGRTINSGQFRAPALAKVLERVSDRAVAGANGGRPQNLFAAVGARDARGRGADATIVVRLRACGLCKQIDAPKPKIYRKIQTFCED